jgi:type I restriction enzyme, R subunit
MLRQNPLRGNYQKRYEDIIAEYNREKDRVTIEKTFAELLKFIGELDKESRRAVREGLDEESQTLFDLLLKPELSRQDIDRIKRVAVELLAKLKEEKFQVDNWREKEATRDAVRVTIRDFLWSEDTGLPVASYSESEVEDKATQVYLQISNAA